MCCMVRPTASWIQSHRSAGRPPQALRGPVAPAPARHLPRFLLTIEDAAEHASLQQALGVDPELQTLYAADFDIDLAHVESLFEVDPQAPDQPPKRAEYKVYRLAGRAQTQ